MRGSVAGSLPEALSWASLGSTDGQQVEGKRRRFDLFPCGEKSVRGDDWPAECDPDLQPVPSQSWFNEPAHQFKGGLLETFLAPGEATVTTSSPFPFVCPSACQLLLLTSCRGRSTPFCFTLAALAVMRLAEFLEKSAVAFCRWVPASQR